MDDEINKLRSRLEELERQKKEEEERNKDPFRHLRQRIEKKTQQMKQCNSNDQVNIQYFINEIECDKSILQALETLQQELKELRKQVTDDRESVDVSVVDILVV